ncbi:MAG: ADP-ribosyltransferase [Actinomadura sp.]
MDAAARTATAAEPHAPDGDRPHDAGGDPAGQHASPVPENLPPRLHDVYRSSEETPNGRSFFSPDEQNMRDLAQRVRTDSDHYVVDGHGSPDGMRVGDQPLSVHDVAELIRNDPNWNGREVMLISCETGQGADSFASQLSRELGVPVIAPEGLAWTDNQGRVFASSGTVDADGTRGPTWPPDGGWAAHQPDGTVTSAGEDGFPPGHEPDNTTPQDAGAVDRTPDDLQMGDDGRLHRPGDEAGTYRTEDGRLHFPGDPENSFRNETTHRLHDSANGGFLKETHRDIDYPADEGERTSHQPTDEAREVLDGLARDRAQLSAETGRLWDQMDSYRREFGIEDRNARSELSKKNLEATIDSLRREVNESSNLSDDQRRERRQQLQELQDLAERYNSRMERLTGVSEQMGMAAGRDFAINERGGTLLTPIAPDRPGTPGTIDVIAFADGDPPRLICVEAKGGSARLGGRDVLVDGEVRRAEQGSPEYLRNVLGRDPDLKAALDANPEVRAKIEQALANGTLEVEYHRVHASEKGAVRQSEFELRTQDGRPFTDRISGTTPVEGPGGPDPSAAARTSVPGPRPESAAARGTTGDADPPATSADGGAVSDGPASRSADENTRGEAREAPPSGAEPVTGGREHSPARDAEAAPGTSTTVPRAETTPGSDGRDGRTSGHAPEAVSGADTTVSRADAELATSGTSNSEDPAARDAVTDSAASNGESDTRPAQESSDTGDRAERDDVDPDQDDHNADSDDAGHAVDADRGETATSEDADSLPGHMDADGIRRFDSDADGERYGEDHLGDTYRGLPPDEQNAVQWYTRQSFPNPFLRPGSDLGGYLQWAGSDVQPGWHLFEMNGGRAPSLGDVYDAAARTDLTPDQRHIVNDILNDHNPGARLEAWLNYAGQRGFLTRYFGTFPTESDFWHRIDEIDRALDQPLPEGVQVQRGLHDVRFMIDAQGDPLGGGDPQSLVGTTQTEPAYMSTSLGVNPTIVDGNPFTYRLHLNLPEGSPGLWLGTNSVFPDQRELIVPRGTQYRITAVTPDGRGGYDIEAVVVPPGS